MQEQENRLDGFGRMFTTFVVVLYVAHFSGCVWAFVSLVSADEYVCVGCDRMNLLFVCCISPCPALAGERWWRCRCGGRNSMAVADIAATCVAFCIILCCRFGNFPESSWAHDWMTANTDYVDKTYLYFYSLYWAFETLSTVGYGDMLPTSTPELVWTSIVMLGGTCTFGYVIASLASLITRADEQAEVKRSEVGKICTWMKHRRLDTDLRARIRDHFECVFTTTVLRSTSCGVHACMDVAVICVAESC